MQMSRRQLSALLLTLAGGSAAAWFWSREPKSPVSLSIDLPGHASGEAPPFEVFLALSKIVTCRDRLSDPVARRLYGIFMAEPWGPEHMSGSYRALRKAILASANPEAGDALFGAAKLNKGETWFVSHLLTTWYLGIYYHENRSTERVCWEEALMYDAVRDVIPVWFSGTREEDYWAAGLAPGLDPLPRVCPDASGKCSED